MRGKVIQAHRNMALPLHVAHRFRHVRSLIVLYQDYVKDLWKWLSIFLEKIR